MTHGLGALVFSGLWVASIIWSVTRYAPPAARRDYLQYAAGWQFLSGILIYGIIAGISHAVSVGRRLRTEQEANTRAEALRARAELSALRAHMNPHFLFNTLHSISGLVRRNPEAVELALERLASLFRFVLDIDRRGVDQIPLGDELEFVRAQLELERLRLADRLTVSEEIEPDALDCLIPVFTLQPLVENAIRHGIATQSAGGHLTIRARTVNDALEITVIDTGAGADPAAIGRAPGLGLRSIRQRLAAMHGDNAGLSITTRPGQGTTARVKLPAIVSPTPANQPVGVS